MLDHYAEPFSPTGSLSSEGVKQQLGRPRKDPLEILVREALQNCWDAKRTNSSQVNVTLDLHPFQGSEIAPLFASDIPESGERLILQARRVLVIADTGTSGLGGVLRADQSEADGHQDFVDFLRNIGQPPDTDFGGGTYGYGKVSLFGASSCSTLATYTSCRYRGSAQRRFMMARLGQQFEVQGKRYTGRHWWGSLATDGVIDPVLDDAADRLGEKFGLRVFEEGELGTSIAIIDPDFGDLGDIEAMALIAEAVAWNFWPKTVDLGSGPPMTVTVRHRGGKIPIPDGSTNGRLRAFEDAFRCLKGFRNGTEDQDPFKTLVPIECLRPTTHLGMLCLVKTPVLQNTESGGERSATNLGQRLHHTCLLRAPELVVKYLEGPPSSSPHTDYAGVFLVPPELDRIFASAEPPTHDDWVPEGLKNPHHRTFVRLVDRRIRASMKHFVEPRPLDSPAEDGYALGEISSILGRLLPDPRRSEGKKGSGGRKRTGGLDSPIAAVTTSHPQLTEKAGGRLLTIPFVLHSDLPIELVLSAEVGIVVDGRSIESEPPSGAGGPSLPRWKVGENAEHHDGVTTGPISPPFPRSGEVSVWFPADLAIEVRILVVEGGDQ